MTHHPDARTQARAVETGSPIPDPFAGVGPEDLVTFAYLQCRACGERGPVVRTDDHDNPEGSWDYDHAQATGHTAFYLFTLSRQTARLFF